MTTIRNGRIESSTKRCGVCGSTTTTLEMTKWGFYPHWYKSPVQGFERLICKNCYERSQWQKKHVPKVVKCNRCGTRTSTISKYGTPVWVRDKRRKNIFYCKACFMVIRDTGQVRPQDAINNMKLGIRRALEQGTFFGKAKYSLDESVFDTNIEEPAYWMGILMADGNISIGKTGNPRIALTLAQIDYNHLVKFSEFLKCTNPILPKKIKYRGTLVIQYYLRFSSKRIAERLVAHGVVCRKSLIAKVIGLENDRHFWRGAFDGDGYFKNKDGRDGDKMIFTGSIDLCNQFAEFIKKNFPFANVTIGGVGPYSRVYIYSNTARAVAELLYSDCKVALERKLVKAHQMFHSL